MPDSVVHISSYHKSPTGDKVVETILPASTPVPIVLDDLPPELQGEEWAIGRSKGRFWSCRCETSHEPSVVSL